MTTIICHNCQRENSGARGFCQFCGSRLALLPPESESSEPNEERRTRGSEHLLVPLRQELKLAKEQLDAAKEELDALKQTAINASSHPAEERRAEETRLRDRLAESERNMAALRLELETAKSQLGSTENQLRDHQASGELTVVSLKRELDLAKEKARTELDEHRAAGERMVATLKQEHAGAIAKVTSDHHEKIAQKETLIEELKARLQGFAEREKTHLAAATAALSGGSGPQQGASRRSFGTMAVSAIAAMFAGAGGVGGYVYRGGSSSSTRKDDQAAVQSLQAKLTEADRLSHDLEDRLRSQREAYERVNGELKNAEEKLKQAASNPAGANDDVQRQLTDLRAAGQQLQQRLGAVEAELAQRKQDIATRDQTIAQLNQQLQEAKSQPSTSHETKDVRPRPRQTIDIDTTIRNLEREYGIPRIGR